MLFARDAALGGHLTDAQPRQPKNDLTVRATRHSSVMAAACVVGLAERLPVRRIRSADAGPRSFAAVGSFGVLTALGRFRHDRQSGQPRWRP